jgi:hypothetical protein
MIPVEEERCLAETHDEMHDCVILAKTNMRPCSENKPIPAYEYNFEGIRLWMLFGNSIWAPTSWCVFVGIGVNIFVVK